MRGRVQERCTRSRFFVALRLLTFSEELGEREEAQRNEEAGSGAALLDSPSHAKPRVSPPALCRFCGLPAPIEQVVAVPDRGFLCLVCLDAIRAASEQDSKD